MILSSFLHLFHLFFGWLRICLSRVVRCWRMLFWGHYLYFGWFLQVSMFHRNSFWFHLDFVVTFCWKIIFIFSIIHFVFWVDRSRSSTSHLHPEKFSNSYWHFIGWWFFPRSFFSGIGSDFISIPGSFWFYFQTQSVSSFRNQGFSSFIEVLSQLYFSSASYFTIMSCFCNWSCFQERCSTPFVFPVLILCFSVLVRLFHTFIQGL